MPAQHREPIRITQEKVDEWNRSPLETRHLVFVIMTAAPVDPQDPQLIWEDDQIKIASFPQPDTLPSPTPQPAIPEPAAIKNLRIMEDETFLEAMESAAAADETGEALEWLDREIYQKPDRLSTLTPVRLKPDPNTPTGPQA